MGISKNSVGRFTHLDNSHFRDFFRANSRTVIDGIHLSRCPLGRVPNIDSDVRGRCMSSSSSSFYGGWCVEAIFDNICKFVLGDGTIFRVGGPQSGLAARGSMGVSDSICVAVDLADTFDDGDLFRSGKPLVACTYGAIR